MQTSVWKTVIATILIIMASACGEIETHYEPVELTKPVKPVLPPIKAEAVQCLTGAAYADIVERDRLRKNYAEECIAIIDANNAGVTKGKK